MQEQGRDEMASLIERLQCEPVLMAVYDKNAADAVRNHASLDMIMIGDVFGLNALNVSICQIRDMTDTPVITVCKSVSNLNLLLDSSNWTELVEPSQGDIEDTLGSLCQWAPAPPHWRPKNAHSYPGKLLRSMLVYS